MSKKSQCQLLIPSFSDVMALFSPMPQQEEAVHLTGNLSACHLTCSVTALNTFAGLKDLSLPSYYHDLCL